MIIKNTLHRILSNSEIHARWLNSLSYLEYRGFRKIVKSHSSSDVDLEVLSHTAEEVRHALFFKKLAIKIGGPGFSRFSEDRMLAPQALKKYFYDLDHGSDRLLAGSAERAHQRAVYLIVTLLIEERAVQVYEKYQQLLDAHPIAISLKPVLSDEEKHLTDVITSIRKQIAGFAHVEESLRELENRCFTAVWSAIEAAVESQMELQLA